MSLSRSKRAAFVAAITVAILTAGIYAVVSPSGSDTPAIAQEEGPQSPRPSLTPAGKRLLASPLLVRAVDSGDPDADGGLFELSASDGVERVPGGVGCRRVHSARQDGPTLCIRVSDNGFDYEAATFDGDRRLASVAIKGVPSRARVSRDGRYAAYTTYVGEGQGYFASTAEFSTSTRIVDLRTGEVVERLERLDVSRDDRRVPLERAELWGVTFGTDGRYYATLASGREHLLIEGRAGSGRARVIGADVECPSLSPDGTRIAYKRRIGNSNRWRLHVRRLDGGGDVALAEQRSIDDQPEWLGDDLVVYSDGKSVYAVPADGGGSAERIAEHATSPAALATP